MATKKSSKSATKAKPRTKPAPVEPAREKLGAGAAADKRTLPFEIDPKKIETSLKKLSDQLVKLAKKGRYTKVRFSFRGKQLLPDIPLAAVAAVEGLSFYWAGLLRLLVFNLAGRTVIDIELVNDSEKKLQAGKEFLLSGDLEEALEAFREAEDMDHDNPLVHLNLGIALKLSGDHESARFSLEQAIALDKEGVASTEAERLLATLRPAPPKPAAVEEVS